jgi:hypothetical protein
MAHGRLVAHGAWANHSPPGHGRLMTDSPSLAAPFQQPPGQGTDRVLIPGAELWRSDISDISDISERICADVAMTTWGFAPTRRPRRNGWC